jgi:hypothetical protein
MAADDRGGLAVNESSIALPAHRAVIPAGMSCQHEQQLVQIRRGNGRELELLEQRSPAGCSSRIPSV